MSNLESAKRPIRLDDAYVVAILRNYLPSTRDSPAMHGAAFQIIERTYGLLFYLNEKLNESRCEVSELYGSRIFFNSELPYHWPLGHLLDFASFFGRWDCIQNHMSKESNSPQADVEHVVSSAILGLAYVGEWQNQKCFMDYLNGIVNILCNYLPRSTDENMHTSTATRNGQTGDHFKWTILFASVSELISNFTRYYQIDEESGQEVIDLCKQVITTIMKHDTGADINMRLRYQFTIHIEDQVTESIRVVVKETLLAFVKRRVYWDLNLIEDIEAFLCDLGATDRRLFYGFEYDYVQDDGGDILRSKPGVRLRLTYTQSERLSHAYSHERLRKRTGPARFLYEVFRGLATEEPMPTEPDPRVEDLVQLLLSAA